MSIVLPSTIKFVITDFDGIVTDNCAYISEDGATSRKINFKEQILYEKQETNY